MGARKEVTGAVMPYAILGGLALIAYKYRDEIIAWFKGEIVGKAVVPPAITPGSVTIPGPAGPARDAGQAVADWLLGLFQPSASPSLGEGMSIDEWTGLGHLTPAAYEAPAAAPLAALLSPSPTAIALGLTGSPLYGYESVMAPISEPSPVVNPYGYREGVYYSGDLKLEIGPGSYGVYRADPRYPGGWENILFGAGAATWYSPALAGYAKMFGV